MSPLKSYVFDKYVGSVATTLWSVDSETELSDTRGSIVVGVSIVTSVSMSSSSSSLSSFSKILNSLIPLLSDPKILARQISHIKYQSLKLKLKSFTTSLSFSLKLKNISISSPNLSLIPSFTSLLLNISLKPFPKT